MTVDARFERDLAFLIQDLCMRPTPHDRTEVLSAAVSTPAASVLDLRGTVVPP